MQSKHFRMPPFIIFSDRNKSWVTRINLQNPNEMFNPKPSTFKVLFKRYLTMISKELGVNGITPNRKGLEEIILGAV